MHPAFLNTFAGIVICDFIWTAIHGHVSPQPPDSSTAWGVTLFWNPKETASTWEASQGVPVCVQVKILRLGMARYAPKTVSHHSWWIRKTGPKLCSAVWGGGSRFYVSPPCRRLSRHQGCREYNSWSSIRVIAVTGESSITRELQLLQKTNAYAWQSSPSPSLLRAFKFYIKHGCHNLQKYAQNL